MNALQQRSLRYELHFPVEFLAEGRIILGECLNISDSGMLGTFEEPLELWVVGELRLHTGQSSRKLDVRVSRVDGHNAGLLFRHESERDRLFIRSIIEDLIAELRQKGQEVTPPF